MLLDKEMITLSAFTNENDMSLVCKRNMQLKTQDRQIKYNSNYNIRSNKYGEKTT